MLESIRLSPKDDHGERPAAKVLLIAQVLIQSDKDGEPVGGGVEERAVAEIRPTLLVNRPGVMAREQPGKLPGNIAVEQNAH